MSVPVHAVPSALGIFAEHVPVEGWHAPGSLQASPLVQTTEGVPAQVPLVQTSPVVHAFMSSHPVLFGAAGLEHTLPLQVPTVWH
jgi:hypothetical protein